MAEAVLPGGNISSEEEEILCDDHGDDGGETEEELTIFHDLDDGSGEL